MPAAQINFRNGEKTLVRVRLTRPMLAALRAAVDELDQELAASPDCLYVRRMVDAEAVIPTREVE